ncbi:sigma-54 dependent transcriptional regulator [Pseudodesulfovibrio thermohalotolerans]|uniref:sigma-54-dependent transcriptional regulator n=1 Tax=Pseudodesulfovibrio thermohalotolerans TaxID=2880651 RepID=UPI0024417F8D|nr:sigma-54 dependent transcriptional regulator [Pseudodesulfovibrio thermohalotolerans]WFS63106.1 sigma-54 dependent transcriptional regulator [Pseudodesulfovibrio thermohalotolerans]
MRILLVDDDAATRESLAEYLTLLGQAVTSSPDADNALRLCRNYGFDMVLSDIQMPGMTGIELVREIKRLPGPLLPDVVLYTGHADLELAIGALRAGAYDYLTKPINLDELKATLQRVAEHQSLLTENDRLTRRFDEVVAEATSDYRAELSRLQDLLEKQAGLDNVGIFSEAMWQVVAQAKRYHEDRDLPVLIQGETGVGKDIIAKIIHYGPDPAPLPFVAINCAALPASLFESELFGYEPGAFTGGASRGARGKIDLARGGTLFLDEIGEIPVELQAKLLRVIEARSYYRVGGLERIEADVRIVAATNLNLGKRIEEGLFRKDLYYRLRVGSIVVPPLRERADDIVPLARLFLSTFSRKRGKRFQEISPEAARLLLVHSWPGNVRELKNTLEWVSVMHDDVELRPEHLRNVLANADEVGVPSSPSPAPPPLPETGGRRRRPTEADIDAALAATSGNKTRAAARLGISIRMLHYRLAARKKDDPEPQ